MSEHQQSAPIGGQTKSIQLPASTAWPIVLAFGVTLAFAGLVTNEGIGIAGLVLVAAGVVGWFRELFPHEAHEAVEIVRRPAAIATVRTSVARIEVNQDHRAHLPVESYPILSGIKGGAAGGVAMIVPALLYGLVAQHSIWYAVNLLGGAGVAKWSNETTAQIATFHLSGLIIATIIHVAVSILVGLLYGAMLPMLPKRPILLGGVLAPVLWTGLIHSTLWFINPDFAARIAWGWFFASQMLFGIVAGIVVTRTGKIRTNQSYPFIMRMGIEAKEFMPPKQEDK